MIFAGRVSYTGIGLSGMACQKQRAGLVCIQQVLTAVHIGPISKKYGLRKTAGLSPVKSARRVLSQAKLSRPDVYKVV